MALIPAEEADRLRAYFAARLVDPVAIELTVPREEGHFRVADRCGSCAQTRALLEELAALSERIRLTVQVLSAADWPGRGGLPEIRLSGAGGRARFIGMPLGDELELLLENLVALSRGETAPPPRQTLNRKLITSPSRTT